LKIFKSLTGNVWRLGVSQGLMMTVMNVNLTNTALVGSLLAPTPLLITLPISIQFVAVMLATIPASLMMAQFGRKPIFLIGVFMVTIGAFGQAGSILIESFELLVFFSFLLGLGQGVAQFYRYAAADSVEGSEKAKAVSLVLLGGLASAIIGPEIAYRTVSLLPNNLYAGCFVVTGLVQMIAIPIILGLDLPPLKNQKHKGRPITKFFQIPSFLSGLTAAALGYCLMTFLMTATPLQVVEVSELSHHANARVIQWHVVAMFAPSLFSGLLIAKFGVQKILWAADSGGSTAGVWMAGTGNGQLFRSTDGAANWSELTKGAGQLPTNWETDGGDRKIVRSMASNGTGQWVIVQDTRIFVSTNDGATFSEVSHGISNIQVIFGIVYTNNSYVIVYDRDDDNKLRVRSAASSDLTTWSSEVSYSPMVFPDGSASEIKHVRMAADSSGRVVFISPDKQGVGYFNVNGTTISNNGLLQAAFSNNPSRDIATNGAGVWLVTCEDGTIFESTNNGTSWTEIIGLDSESGVMVPDASTNINCIASNYYLPL